MSGAEEVIELAFRRAWLRVGAFDLTDVFRFVPQLHAVHAVLEELRECLDYAGAERELEAVDFCSDQVCGTLFRASLWRSQQSWELFEREGLYEAAKVRAALEGLRLDLDWIKSEEEKEDK